MKKLFKDWTILELILLFSSISAVVITAIIFNSDWLTPLCSVVGITTALLLAKGKALGQFFGIAIVVLYSIVSFREAYYGEMIVYIGIMLPLYIYGIFSWLNNRNKKENVVLVNTIKAKEWIILFFASLMIFVGVYFLLKAFNTNLLIISTFSVLDSIFATYLVARRSKFGFVFYIINDVVLILLWGIPVILGNLILVPMLINPIVNSINDTYGVINFTRLRKKQLRNNNK